MKFFLRVTLKSLSIVIFPISMIFTYLVYVGIYSLDDNRYMNTIDFISFILFHILFTINLIFYMKIITSEAIDTTMIFPEMDFINREPNLSDINPFIAKEIIKMTYDSFRTCTICKVYKPPRAHHCYTCNRCFLKMDHHCTPLGRCIEFHNYKVFVQFLISNIPFSLFVLISFIFRLFEKNPIFRVYYIASILISSIDFVISLGFSIFHIKLILKNETTIEHYALNEIMNGNFTHTSIFQEGPVTGILDLNRLKREKVNPYCLSKMQNWKQVFGENKINWVLPLDSSIGDGINFPKNYNQEMYEIL
ncbi:Palmitoyltransferase PFA3 [Dictyocoela muelleri]|nr:Palmitoyltransferase PFA3 [Dictyocoela muelleri]